MKKLFTFLFITVCLAVNAQTFQSAASGNWSNPASWTLVSGTDTDGIPDASDDVTVQAGHTIKLTTSAFFKTLTVDNSGFLNGNSKAIFMYGDFNLTGKVTGTLYIYVKAAGTFSSATNYANSGSFIVQSGTLTIAAGTSIIKASTTAGNMQCSSANTRIVNNGTVTLGKGSLFLQSTGRWINNAGSFLKVSQSFTLSSGALLFAAAANNTVTIDGTASVLPPGSYNQLFLNSNVNKTMTGNVTVNDNLTIKAGTLNRLNVSSFKLSIGGNLANSGTITSIASSTVAFNGASATTQTISGNGSTFTNLEINNTGGSGVIFATTTQNNVSSVLNVIQGDCNSNNRLTLLSDASTTARIAPIATPTNVSFSGVTIIQKYFDAFATRFSDLSSPVSNSVVMDWDNELYISGIGPNDGIGGPAGVDGDVPNGFQSMNIFDETTNAYTAVTGSATPLDIGKGYDLYFEDYADGVWDAKTIDTRGIPNFGDITLTLSRTAGQGNGFHLIGNPYASCLTYTNCTLTSMQSTFVGILDAVTGNVVNRGNSYLITPHQGFWVRTVTSSATHQVTFTESAKSTSNVTAYNRLAPNYDIKLMLTSPSTAYYQENKVSFEPTATLNYDDEFDAPYIKSPIRSAPGLFMVDTKTGELMTENAISNAADEVTIPIGFFTPKTALYYINASVLNMDSYSYAWIENIKTGKQYDLNSNEIAVQGNENQVNNDYVLRLSKAKKSSSVSETILETDLDIFNTENAINLKSTVSNHSIKELSVYDMTGKLVLSQLDINIEVGNTVKVDISNLANGIYVVSATDNKGKAITKKLIK